MCWWEDDGQDNEKADAVFGGPNGDLSLTQARYNALTHGNSDRSDYLASLPQTAGREDFARIRVFEYDRVRGVVTERASGWSSAKFVASDGRAE